MTQFSVGSPDDFLDLILLPLHEDFVGNNSSIAKAVSSIVMAYHLFEWVHQEAFNVKKFAEIYPDEKQVAKYFEIARKIANGFKHNAEKIATRKQVGFSSGFSSGFARPLVIIGTDTEEHISVDVLLENIVNFWRGQQAAGWPTRLAT